MARLDGEKTLLLNDATNHFRNDGSWLIHGNGRHCIEVIVFPSQLVNAATFQTVNLQDILSSLAMKQLKVRIHLNEYVIKTVIQVTIYNSASSCHLYCTILILFNSKHNTMYTDHYEPFYHCQYRRHT